MTIDYELSIDDMVALATFHSEHSGRERRRRLLVQGFIVVVFVLLLISAISTVVSADMTWTPASLAISFLPLICPSILLVLVFTPAVRHWQTKRSVHKAFGTDDGSQPVGLQHLTIGPNTITVETEASNMVARWADVTSISAWNSHVFIYTASDQAIVVPRRAFSSEANYQDFLNRIQNLQRSAGPDPGQ